MSPGTTPGHDPVDKLGGGSLIRLRRHALGLGTAILAIAGVAIAAAPATPVVAQTQLQVGLPTIVDPVRAVGEPDIAVDNQNNAWISGPAGSSTQTSFYWHSLDGGLTYPMLGPGAGHWVCPASGGGDSLIEVDRVNGNVDLTDQEALASLGTGRTAGDGSNLNSKCLATPAMSADRPFEAILHPATSVKAPQYLANGNTPLTYLSWLCDACGTGVPGNLGGLAFAWTADGVNWHAADAGVPADNLVTNQFFEATSINSFHWHGTMVADPVTSYIFTGLSCSGSCVNGKTDNEFGVAEGKQACSAGPNCPSPGTQADASNVGEFASETYNEASGSYNGQPWPEPGSLFPVLTQDSNRTLYLAWIEGDGSVTTGSPPAASWHAYYAYSTDLPDHKVWSAPIRIDRGAQDLTNAMTWVAAGDAGKLAAIWLSSPVRMYPSDQSNQTRPWYPHMAVSTNANTANPSFQEVQVSGGPNHIGDVCLNGTLCGASSPPGNEFVVTVPPNLVGNVGAGAVLQSVTGYS